MNRSIAGLTVAACLSASLNGCFEFRASGGSGDFADWEEEVFETPPPPSPPPRIVWVDVPSWPPLGPAGKITVRVEGTERLSTIEYGFRNHLVRSPEETTISATELGEGYGTLVVRATDVRGAFARQEVQDLLVDLSPPEVTLTETVIQKTGKLRVWVADAWVLGSVELDFGGIRRSHHFQVGYPETLGKTWDFSLVEFRADEFPSATGPARLTARDAAGNEVTEVFDLTIDGKAPTVAFVEPAPGAVVSDELRVVLQAHDDAPGPVSVQLFAGGALVATVLGPNSILLLDTSDFPPGPLELSAIALDAAGNESRTATVPVVLGG